MTPEQFQALHRLMGWHKGSKTAGACALVLVEGLKQAEAARLMGVSRSNVSASLAKAHQVQEAARVLVAAS